MKRYLATLLALVLLFTGLAAIASAAEEPGMQWDEDTGNYYYVKADGTRVKDGWYYISDGTRSWWDKHWVYGESSGFLKNGWYQEGGSWYYLWPEMVTSGYYDFADAKLYIFNPNGVWTKTVTQPGWFKAGNDWYYAQTEYNWYYDETTDEYYKDENDSWLGLACNGVYTIDGKNYCFDENGKMVTGWIQPYNQDYQDLYWRRAWYYAKPDGVVAEGWQKIDGDWYYFEEGGRMKDMGATQIDGKRYVMDYQSGKMVSNQWYLDTWIDYWGSEQVVTGSWLYLGPDGVAKTGWFKDGNTWYYANEYGDMVTGWLKDGDARYYLKESGAMAKNEWIEEGGSWKFIKGNGAMAENEWIEDGSAWYWMKDGGAMAANETIAINGKEYKFADNGVWIP